MKQFHLALFSLIWLIAYPVGAKAELLLICKAPDRTSCSRWGRGLMWTNPNTADQTAAAQRCTPNKVMDWRIVEEVSPEFELIEAHCTAAVQRFSFYVGEQEKDGAGRHYGCQYDNKSAVNGIVAMICKGVGKVKQKIDLGSEGGDRCGYHYFAVDCE